MHDAMYLADCQCLAPSDSVLACDQALVASSVVDLAALVTTAGVTKLVRGMTTAAMIIINTAVSTDPIMHQWR